MLSKSETIWNELKQKGNGKDFDKAKSISGLNGHADVQDSEDSVRRWCLRNLEWDNWYQCYSHLIIIIMRPLKGDKY